MTFVSMAAPPAAPRSSRFTRLPTTKLPAKRHQIEATTALVSNPRFLLGHTMGSGKSRILLDAATQLGLKRILILGPASAAFSWRKQTGLWASHYRFTHIKKAFDLAGDGVFFVSYDQAIKLQLIGLMSGGSWDVIICDECHYLKNFKARRTRLVFGGRLDGTNGLLGHTPKLWLASGTPAPNHVGELYPMLRACFPQTLRTPILGRIRSLHEFMQHFTVCDVTQWGSYRVHRNRNVGELRRALSSIMLRPTEEEMGLHLEPAQVQVEPIDIGPKNRAILAARMQHLQDVYDAAGGDEDLLLQILHEEGGSLSTERRVLGETKAAACASWLIDQLETGEKWVAFGWHHSVLDAVAAAISAKGYAIARIDGRSSDRQRADSLTRFQEDPDCRLMVAQISAAGVAVDMTASARCAFIEYDWNPSSVAQAIARLRRIGQKRRVLVKILFAADTVDELITDTASRKAANFAQVL